MLHCIDAAVQSFDATNFDSTNFDATNEFSSEPANEPWLDQQEAYEKALQEKSEEIRSLHERIQELESVQLQRGLSEKEAQPIGQATGILRLKRELAQRQRLLKQAEEHMVAQMRELEVSIATERVEIARQRQQVERLKEELERERDKLQRDQQPDRIIDLQRARHTMMRTGLFSSLFGWTRHFTARRQA